MTRARRTLLVLGGYGAFGGRLVRLLANEPQLTILVAGRSLERARRFCADVAGEAELVPLAFDRDGDVAAQLAAAGPDILVDASGPFQAYGAAPYRVVEAALSRGVHYMDLADGTAFVLGVGRFDAEARARGVFVLSGVSTFPVLSGAAVRRLADGLAHVDTVAAGIAPSPHAGLGLSVIRAIASYAGKPVPLVRDGRPAVGRGLIEARRYTIAPPGALPLHSRRFSLIDIPDFRILPERWPGLRAVWAGAGPVPGILHRGLNAMSWLVRLRLAPTLAPLAPLFHAAVNLLRRGEHRSGMFVEVTGRLPDGTPARRAWRVLAEGDDGPIIPSMPAAALVRRALAGTPPGPGARPADADLELEDYEAQFAHFRIAAGVRDEAAVPAGAPLYARALGEAWPALPAVIRNLHQTRGVMVAQGTATVERGRNPLARLAGALFRFPRAGVSVPVRVEIAERDGGEVWRRSFAGRRMTSVQRLGAGRWDRLVVERFGPFRFGLALVVDAGRLRLVPRRWSAFGLPMPLALGPRGESYEAEAGESGRFRFHVEIRLPGLGLIVRYQGALERRS